MHVRKSTEHAADQTADFLICEASICLNSLLKQVLEATIFN